MLAARDVRFALRALRGAPMVTILAIACIALGIGAVTTVYSTASAFTFRPLPQLAAAGDLVLIAEAPATERNSGFTTSAPTFEALRALPEFSAVGAFVDWTANIAGFDVPERVSAARVSPDFFRMTGRTAARGVTFVAEDYTEDRRVVVLSDGLWRRRFGAQEGIIGATVRINGEGYR